MTVKELKDMLDGVDENMEVFIPAAPQFDGFFYRPCIEDSGVSELGVDEYTSENWFILVPCGFFDLDEDDFDPELN